MSTFVNSFEKLLRNCEEKEQQLDQILNFSTAGGEFRIRVSIDHPDEAVRKAVEALAATYVPTKAVLSQVVRGASTEYRKAKEEVVRFAANHPINTEGKAA